MLELVSGTFVLPASPKKFPGLHLHIPPPQDVTESLYRADHTFGAGSPARFRTKAPVAAGRQRVGLAGRRRQQGALSTGCLASSAPTSILPHHRDSAARAGQGPVTHQSPSAWSMGTKGAAPSPVSPLGWQAGQWWHCCEQDPASPWSPRASVQVRIAGFGCDGQKEAAFPFLQSAEGNIIQSQQDSASVWDNLCPVPVPRLPQPHVHSPVPGIPEAPGGDGFLHRNACEKMLGLCASQFWGCGDEKDDTG